MTITYNTTELLFWLYKNKVFSEILFYPKNIIIHPNKRIKKAESSKLGLLGDTIQFIDFWSYFGLPTE